MTVKRARKQIYKKGFVVLICLLMFGSLAHGAVLCFGSNGHISIEFKTIDCCGKSMGIPAQASPDSCGDCIDIPFPGNYVTKQPASFVTKKSSSLKIFSETIVSVSTNNSVSTNKERVAEHRNPVSDTLTSIRTTVLLI